MNSQQLLSASKVQWPELSQLSLCSEFDKENSMEFSLISLLLIHFTTVAMCLLSHGPHVTLVMWHTVTIHHTIVTLWQSHMILSHAPSCSCKKRKEKKKKRKRNINNDLAILPSHDSIAFGINLMAWSHLDRSSSFSKMALLKTQSLKSSYSLGISSSFSSIFALLMFSSSLLYASSSRLTNNTFSPSSIAFSSISFSTSSSGSPATYIFLHYC